MSMMARHFRRWSHDLAELPKSWRCRLRHRRDLVMMTDQELKDVGLTRCDVLHEAAKPFWRA
jgi:uncharacterized protein YjiS (DUF1127 family)